jgi:hypothetical protein
MLQKLTPQLPESGRSDQNSPDMAALDYALMRTELMFGCFRKGEANDPEIYAAGVAKTLAMYPRDCIDYVTDAVTGWPAKSDFFPSVREIRAECEAYCAPVRRAMEREAAERRQIAERKTLAIADGCPRKTYEQLIEECRAAGLNIGPKKIKAKPVDVDALCASTGITREQFDKLPNAPDRR